jgi:hypothetical protein
MFSHVPIRRLIPALTQAVPYHGGSACAFVSRSGLGRPENDFTNRNTTFMTYNLMHLAQMLRTTGGAPSYGNQRSEWDAGCRFDSDNPEHR